MSNPLSGASFSLSELTDSAADAFEAESIEIVSDDIGAEGNIYSYIQVKENTASVTNVNLKVLSSEVRYSLNAGADRELFEIDARTGEISFKQAPNFEKPQDQLSETAAAGDNFYEINVLATDGKTSDSQYLTVEVVNEPEDIDSPVSVYLMAGQSNLVGEGLSENLDPFYASPFPETQIWSVPDWQFVDLSPNYDWRATVGPEISFGRAIAQNEANDVYIVKYGMGDTTLAQDWDPEGGAQYNTFVEVVDAALADLEAKGLRYEIDGLVWMQGESDTYNSRFADEYQDNLTNFIGSVRDRYDSDLDVAIGLIRNDLPTYQPSLDVVRAAQREVAQADSQVVLVDTDSLGASEDVLKVEVGDLTHYSATGQTLLGEAFADAFLS